jgi:hypothetical protein
MSRPWMPLPPSSPLSDCGYSDGTSGAIFHRQTFNANALVTAVPMVDDRMVVISSLLRECRGDMGEGGDVVLVGARACTCALAGCPTDTVPRARLLCGGYAWSAAGDLELATALGFCLAPVHLSTTVYLPILANLPLRCPRIHSGLS